MHEATCALSGTATLWLILVRPRQTLLTLPCSALITSVLQYKKEHQAVIDAMTRGATVYECIQAIESA